MDIRGVYCNTIFRNASTGYTVFKLKLSEYIEGYDEIYLVCCGNVQSNFVGIPLLLSGEMIKNDNEQTFSFTDIKPHIKNEEDVINYPIFKGIPKTAIAEMTNKYGPDVYEWDNKVPNLIEGLSDIKGISIKRATAIYNHITAFKKQKELFKYVQGFGENISSADEFINEYNTEALNKLKKHPYVNGNKLKLSFRCCDAIAKANGFKADNPERVNAIISEVMQASYNNGNTCFPLDRILNGANWVIKHISVFPDEELSAFQFFATLIKNKKYISYINKEKDLTEFYFNYSYINEITIAKNIMRLASSSQQRDIDINKLVLDSEKQLNIKYNEMQKSCFNFLKSEGVKIITGGPGTGKTTVINGIIHAYQKLYPDKQIVMMAPTGRAAQKISEVTHREAGTIHRMLNISARAEHEFISDFTADYPADLIVIDEASMIDNEIAAQAFSAFKGGSTVVLVGDIDQLPSVGAGNVLYNLINSKMLDTVQLSVNYRQGDLSTIAANAERIKIGDTQLFADENFNLIKCESSKEMQEKALNKFCELYNSERPFETQMLNAVKDGPTGVIYFNNSLQEAINKNKTLLQIDKYGFKIGDKVIITENNYDDMCFNGDIGIIKNIEEGNIELIIGDKEVIYPPERKGEIHLAYSMSIHKSQGSEYENVIICLPPESSNMLKRKLIYTAITRAKKNVYVYYMGNALNKAITLNNDAKRISELEAIIKKGV